LDDALAAQAQRAEAEAAVARAEELKREEAEATQNQLKLLFAKKTLQRIIDDTSLSQEERDAAQEELDFAIEEEERIETAKAAAEEEKA